MLQDKLARIILLLLALLAMATLAGCASGSDMASESNFTFDAAASMDFAASPAVAESVEMDSIGNLNILSPVETGRQLIYTTNINLQTTDFMVGLRSLLDMVVELDGYSEFVLVNGRDLNRPDIARNANFNFRIPTENLTAFIIFIEQNYNLVRLEQRMVDMTNIYEWDTAELEILRVQEAYLVYNEAPQSDLNDIRRQIRSLEQTNTNLQDQVVYSTVTVHLAEVFEMIPHEPATFGDRVGETLGESFIYLLEFLQVVLIVLIAIIPWGIPTGIIVGLIIYLNKLRKTKRESVINQSKE